MVVASEARGKLLPLTSSPPFAAGLQGELTMLSKLILAAAAATLLAAGEASAAEYEMVNHADLVFAEHDGTKLVGDLYLPKGRSRAPVLVAVHGGGWQVGHKQFYRNWGLFLPRAGRRLRPRSRAHRAHRRFRRRASRFAGGARRRSVQHSVPRRRQRRRSDQCQMRHRFLRRL